MNEEMMTTGFTGGDAATGPTAGFDPVLGKFRRKLKKRRSKEEKKLVMPGNKLSEADMTGAPSIKDAKPAKSTPVKNYPGLGIAPTIAGLKKASKGGKIKKEETEISEGKLKGFEKYMNTKRSDNRWSAPSSSGKTVTNNARLLARSPAKYTRDDSPKIATNNARLLARSPAKYTRGDNPDPLKGAGFSNVPKSFYKTPLAKKADIKNPSSSSDSKKSSKSSSSSSTSIAPKPVAPPDPIKGVMTGDPDIKGAITKVTKASPKLSKDNEKKPEKILNRSKKKLKESRENPTFPSRLFQYKVSIPEVGETIIYANSLAELTQKMRLLVNPRYRGDIKIERIMPGKAAQFFMDKRMKHMKNIKEEETKDAKEQADDKIRAAKKKVQLRKQEMQKQLATKTRQLKRAAAAGQAPAEDS